MGVFIFMLNFLTLGAGLLKFFHFVSIESPSINQLFL